MDTESASPCFFLGETIPYGNVQSINVFYCTIVSTTVIAGTEMNLFISVAKIRSILKYLQSFKGLEYEIQYLIVELKRGVLSIYDIRYMSVNLFQVFLIKSLAKSA